MEENSESGFCPWQQTRRVSANRNLFPHTHWACRSQFTFDTKSAEVTQTPVVMAPSLRSAHISSVYHNLGVTYMCDQLTVNSDILWLNSHVEQVIRIAHRNWDPLLISSVQSLSRVWLFAIPWTAAHQASLSMANTRSPPKPMSIESVMPSNHLILCRPLSSCPQSFPASGSFPRSQLFASGGQSIGVSASTSVLSTNTQDWSPLGWTDWISLQSKGLSGVFSNAMAQKHQFFWAQISL